MNILTRQICLEILNDLFNSFSIEASVKKNKKFQKLTKTDKSFVKMILFTFLRRNGEIDYLINQILSTPLKKKNYLISNILRMGITQIIFLNVKDYSAVSTAVEVTKIKFPGYSKLVNAVLRKACSKKKNFLLETNPIRNLPEWLQKSWESNYGKVRTQKIAEQIIKLPNLDINIKKLEFDKKSWSNIFDGKNIFKQIVRIEHSKGEISKVPFYKEGKWWVQNLSSSFAVEIINHYFKKKILTTKKILEIGSAPGGKTAQLLDYGFDVTAIEISKERIKRLKENLTRLSLRTKIINKDILKWNNKHSYDCVLIDAPCSGTGIIRKKPEILINIHKKKLAPLTEKQKLILEKISKMISVKGLIIYTVCSIEIEEGRNQIEKFLMKNKNFKLLDIDNEIFGNIELRNINGMIEITPECNENIGGADGFFVASLQRVY